jgi:flagellar operon protein (TIGR03826 family)
MPISNCTRCGSIFSRVNKPICPKCLEKEEKDFEKAVEWLRENPGCGIQELSEATGVERQDILRWIRENRIVMTNTSELVKCKKCGAPISSGNFCDQCKSELSNEVTENLKPTGSEKSDQQPGRGMHYLPSDHGRRHTP